MVFAIFSSSGATNLLAAFLIFSAGSPPADPLKLELCGLLFPFQFCCTPAI